MNQLPGSNSLVTKFPRNEVLYLSRHFDHISLDHIAFDHNCFTSMPSTPLAITFYTNPPASSISLHQFDSIKPM